MNKPLLTSARTVTTRGVHIVTLAGEIDNTTAGIFLQALTPDGPAPQRTIIDFRDVTFMDSSGINVLINANNNAHAAHQYLDLADVHPPVSEVLHIIGLDDLMRIYTTLDQALNT
ncbi:MULTISPECIES: STAS domain-containing protein [unclassified Streptomyces]|uniref:STAS domain-containing protein n=1 Tax=unclassified Streptomyces TaxID=2593676 RepID=UPI0035E2E6DA